MQRQLLNYTLMSDCILRKGSTEIQCSPILFNNVIDWLDSHCYFMRGGIQWCVWLWQTGEIECQHLFVEWTNGDKRWQIGVEPPRWAIVCQLGSQWKRYEGNINTGTHMHTHIHTMLSKWKGGVGGGGGGGEVGGGVQCSMAYIQTALTHNRG